MQSIVHSFYWNALEWVTKPGLELFFGRRVPATDSSLVARDICFNSLGIVEDRLMDKIFVSLK